MVLNWHKILETCDLASISSKDILDEHGVESEIVEFTSLGDRSLGGNLSSSVGQFIHSIDNELVKRSIDIAVHSSKDVPVEIPKVIENLAYLEEVQLQIWS